MFGGGLDGQRMEGYVMKIQSVSGWNLLGNFWGKNRDPLDIMTLDPLLVATLFVISICIIIIGIKFDSMEERIERLEEQRAERFAEQYLKGWDQ